MFIVIFKSVDTVINNRRYFYRNSIEKSAFCDLKTFLSMVIHESNSGTFRENQSTERRVGTFMSPDLLYIGVCPTMGWGAYRVFSPTGHDDVRCDEFVLGLL